MLDGAKDNENYKPEAPSQVENKGWEHYDREQGLGTLSQVGNKDWEHYHRQETRAGTGVAY